MPSIDFSKAKGLLVKAIYSEGYEKDLEKTCTTWLAFRHPNGDKVVVSQKSGYTKYFNPNVAADKGDTIDFLLHRVEGFINTNVSRAGNVDRIAAKIRAIDHSTLVEKAYTPAAASKKKSTKYTYKTELFIPKEMPEGVKKLLHKRSINPLLLQNSDVAPQLALLQILKDNVPVANNLLFRFRDEQGKFVGGQYKYLSPAGGTAKMFTPNTPREHALWITSPIADKTAIFICEDPIDALSFRQLHPERNYALIATGGSISEGQLNFIKQLALKFNKPLVLGNDNDIAGQLANLEIIKTFSIAEQDKVAIPATINGHGYDIKGTVDSVSRCMNRTLVSVRYDEPDPLGCTGSVVYNFQVQKLSAQNSMKIVSKNNKEQTAVLKINGVEEQYTLDQLKGFVKEMATTATIGINVAIPQAKDWNEDLLNAPQKAENSPILTELLQQDKRYSEQAEQRQKSHIKL